MYIYLSNYTYVPAKENNICIILETVGGTKKIRLVKCFMTCNQ